MGRRGACAALWVVVVGLAPAGWAKGGDAAALRAQLGAANPATASTAATALGALRFPAALDALLDGLALGLAPDVAEAALDAVARHGAERSLPLLLAYSHHRNPAVRTHAVQALGALAGSSAATHAVLAALGDEEASVRAAAGKLLAARKDARAVAPLLALFAGGDDVAGPPLAALADTDVAQKVADLAGKAPDPLVARTLGQMARRRDLGPETTYVAVVRAIGAIPGAEATAELRALADTPGVPPAARHDATLLAEERAK